jgi:hypothetical protein
MGYTGVESVIAWKAWIWGEHVSERECVLFFLRNNQTDAEVNEIHGSYIFEIFIDHRDNFLEMLP